MRFLEQLSHYRLSEKLAMVQGESSLTYKELWDRSDQLAQFIKLSCSDSKTPIVVYGHKKVEMLICFVACVKTGRAYVPVDVSVPRDRVEKIIDAVQAELILTTEELEPYKQYPVLDVVHDQYDGKTCDIIPEIDYVNDSSIYYIIFTSGSTGNPKGVQITYSALNNFIEWALSIGSCNKQNKTYINQAPFSFDLSVMDLYMALASESCLFSLDKGTQSNYRDLYDQLGKSDANIWVSTPSFADMCLVDQMFCESLMPRLEQFMFCGEMLTNKTAMMLKERFPNAEIFNTYGPTESTVAVTEVLVDYELIEKCNPLPVGRAKPGTFIKIMDGAKELSDGEKGEIVIVGNTVSAGYLNNEAENKKAFFNYELDGIAYPAYRTGDKGYLKDGMLYYSGRIDFQIKLHGYRMELEDIEKNLLKVPHVRKVSVVPIWEDGKVKFLKAYCIYDGEVVSQLKTQKAIKEFLKKYVPDYMVPKKFVFVEDIPMTPNGKVDKKRLQELY